eukprot:CAMPEP_0174316008 /NCGR_PEP_ID=MMETSP0810-20121108/6648_1 /TAXON_ID=73025 ORGANISM="Eutreptiella gymnastica-like, Strain CCMP1594" /NCGR_SAMPLE_ID=MMETSP0810 /ASSEMBLY_ACC=CAM_ASM_000659 /LENGTH=276 /DNA_ID=CAMNT_0015425547 /DNA_START=35 /DNA_END=865 /DNA_ORIENTATION=-
MFDWGSACASSTASVHQHRAGAGAVGDAWEEAGPCVRGKTGARHGTGRVALDTAGAVTAHRPPGRAVVDQDEAVQRWRTRQLRQGLGPTGPDAVAPQVEVQRRQRRRVLQRRQRLRSSVPNAVALEVQREGRQRGGLLQFGEGLSPTVPDVVVGQDQREGPQRWRVLQRRQGLCAAGLHVAAPKGQGVQRGFGAQAREQLQPVDVEGLRRRERGNAMPPGALQRRQRRQPLAPFPHPLTPIVRGPRVRVAAKIGAAGHVAPPEDAPRRRARVTQRL